MNSEKKSRGQKDTRTFNKDRTKKETKGNSSGWRSRLGRSTAEHRRTIADTEKRYWTEEPSWTKKNIGQKSHSGHRRTLDRRTIADTTEEHSTEKP